MSCFFVSHRKESFGLGFCTSGVKVKHGKGKNAQDTFSKMLQELQGVSEPIAMAIVAIYPSVVSLYRKYSALLSENKVLEAHLLLSSIIVSVSFECYCSSAC